MDFSYYEMDILVKRLNINNLHGFRKNVPSTNSSKSYRFIKKCANKSVKMIDV